LPGRVGALLLLAAALLATGCASLPPGTQRSAVDPIEPFNRAVFEFNRVADDVVVAPVARTYQTVVPELIRWMAGNAFGNLADLTTSIHQLLQGKPSEAISDFSRFVINSTLGFAGVADVASDMGFEKHREDFGQTAGRWGIGTGPYLVLPFFGPSNVRDGLGLAADFVADPLRQLKRDGYLSQGRYNSTWIWRAVDVRALLLDATRTIEEVSLDRYSFVRDSYLQRRRSLVWDGDPPEEPLLEEPLPEENK
jgi:phospholipid-binding lipoprotein MlaA